VPALRAGSVLDAQGVVAAFFGEAPGGIVAGRAAGLKSDPVGRDYAPIARPR
jgi:hypothetical protein